MTGSKKYGKKGAMDFSLIKRSHKGTGENFFFLKKELCHVLLG
jgi:hypothetical protein